MTYDEISRELGLTRAAVFTIEQRALAKIRLALYKLALQEGETYTHASNIIEPTHPAFGCRRVPARIPFDKGDDT